MLARERGGDRPPPWKAGPGPVPATVQATAPRGLPRAERRMLVVAALGADEGRAALRAVARWGLRSGRRPAALDLGCGTPAHAGEPPENPPNPESHRLPLACVPCGPERLRIEPPEVVADLVERLRRHESASDLLLLRVSLRHRMVLMRGALLSGGIVVPLEDSDSALHEAFRLSREVLEHYVDLALWPFPGRPRALERYLAMMRDFLGAEPRALDAAMEEGPGFLERLPPAPEEGFLAALMAPDEAPAPLHLLETGFLRL